MTMCCMSLTLAVKLIGTFGLSLSILMINMLVSNFFSTKEEEDFIIAMESWMLFGLNWTYVMKTLKVVETARTLLTCVLIYSTLSLIANALLALGSLLGARSVDISMHNNESWRAGSLALAVAARGGIASAASKKPSYTLPWMYMQMISIIDQTIALVMQLTQDEKYDPQDKSIWYIPACSIYLLISSYFWMVVSAARRDWVMNAENIDDYITRASSMAMQIPDNSNLPKTPSFLSSNVMFVSDYPKPLSPPKYDVV